MSPVNMGVLTIIIAAALAGIILLVMRNRKDEKEFESTGIEDRVEEAKTDQQRNREHY